jgi:cytosine/adenosine deaminase-related metal-dependent hydrolase
VRAGRENRQHHAGKDADIILLRTDDLAVFPVTDPVATIVSAGHPGLVDTVLVAGRVVKRDGVLVGVDLAALRTAPRPEPGVDRHSRCTWSAALRTS